MTKILLIINAAVVLMTALKPNPLTISTMLVFHCLVIAYYLSVYMS